MISTRNIALFGIYKEETKKLIYTAKKYTGKRAMYAIKSIIQGWKYYKKYKIIKSKYTSDCLNTSTEIYHL